MKKIISGSIMLLILFLLVGCQSDQKKDIPLEKEITLVSGLEDINHPVGKYFNPLDQVFMLNEYQVNVKHLFEVKGFVDYGTVGSYTLSYDMTYGEASFSYERTITVTNDPIQTLQAPVVSYDTSMFLGSGTLRTGTAPDMTHAANPTFIDNDLKQYAIPSSSWWTSLIVQAKGGGNGIYTNPYRVSFQGQGAEFTNANKGFVQYWEPDGFHTMANFSLAIKDVYVKTTTLQSNYDTYVTGYGDNHVEVALRNPGDLKDHMIVTMAQGSPYVFYQVLDKNSAILELTKEGNQGYEFFSTSGLRIEEDTYTGDGLVVKIKGKHVGYQTTYPQGVGQPIFEDVYMYLSTPENTLMTFTDQGIRLSMDNYNMFSLSTINGISDTRTLKEASRMIPIDTDASYQVIEATSEVHTTFTTSYINPTKASITPLIMVLPHHQLYSDLEYIDFSLTTARGEILTTKGNQFKTTHMFHGVIPNYSLPSSTFDAATQEMYFESLDTLSQTDDMENLLNDPAPYWNGKVLFPLAQSLIAANEMNSEYETVFIARLKHVLEDWFTYFNQGDDKFLYYNPYWNTTYYSDNTFNTGSELSDHSFTHGYIVYAATILSQYDDTFKEKYLEIIDFFINDYLYPKKDQKTHRYLRNFDSYAGHTWAHGYGTFAEGNNIESTSEAIQSWVAGYLWSLETDNKALRDAAIYGYVHEVASAKMYMFDYEDSIFPNNYDDYADVAGMIWGGKYDYATWFGANPTFIYGIQWLPNNEYLTSYALNNNEKQTLTNIFATYMQAKDNTIDTWFANMWTIQAIVDSEKALTMFDANKILNDDYPTDLSHTYYLIHGIHHFGDRETSYRMVIHEAVSSSIYQNDDGDIIAIVWNPTNEKQTITFITPTGEQITKSVNANTLTTIDL